MICKIRLCDYMRLKFRRKAEKNGNGRSKQGENNCRNGINRVFYLNNNGNPISTTMFGEPKGKTTVLINGGWASTPELYYSIAEEFENNGLPTVVLSMRGTTDSYGIGNSTAKTYIRDNANDSLDLLRHLEVEGIILAPHSCGAQVVLEIMDILNRDKKKIPTRRKYGKMKVSGIIFNAPSIPETIGAFADQSLLNKIGKFAASMLIRVVKLLNRNGKPTKISKFIARLTIRLFKMVNPILIRKASKKSKESFGKFWSAVDKMSDEMLAISIEAIILNGKEKKKQLENIDVPVLTIGYSEDSLVKPTIGYDVMKTLVLTGNGIQFNRIIEGESHFGFEGNGKYSKYSLKFIKRMTEINQ